jgi:uncharacterized protein YggE
MSFLVATIAKADPLPSQPHIYVEGESNVRVAPDLIHIQLSLDKTDPNVAVAKAAVDRRSRMLIDACKQMGIQDQDISSSNLQIRPEYEYRGQHHQKIGTKVSRQVDITLKDLTHYPDLIRALVEGEVGEITETSLGSSREQQLRDQALDQAFSDAKSRAERLASSAGSKLGPVHSISEFRVRQDIPEVEIRTLLPKRRVQMDQITEEPFEPGLLEITGQVYVVFLLRD